MYEEIVDEQLVSYLILSMKVVAAYVAVLWIALCYWTFLDARRRSSSLAIQIAAPMLVISFFIPGLLVYLLVRPRTTIAERSEARLQLALALEYAGQCPNCRGHVREDYILCPACSFTLRSSCGRCSHALERTWSQCPYCGLVSENANERAKQKVGSEPIEVGQPVHA
jgi:hypothetical protein